MQSSTPNPDKIARRKVRFESLDELLQDAEKMAQIPVQTIGNWSRGQIYDHLAKSLDISIDGTRNVPAPVRWLISLLFKRKFLNDQIPAGFKAGANAPEAVDTPVGLERLRAAVNRQRQVEQRALHPGFGKITKRQWELFHLRHGELHLSFILPDATNPE